MSGLQLLSPLTLLALLPLAGVIILLYLLRLRRRELVVGSTFLWRRTVQDVQANVPFQRLRRNLLLLLQLLALLLLVLALAGPFFLSRRLSGSNVVILLDASASMKATDLPGSRFEEARRQALALGAGLKRDDEVAVIVCGARPRVDLPFSRDRRRLTQVLRAAQPTDCATNVRDGLLLALSLVSRRREADLYLFSDGGFAALPSLNVPARLHFICLGKRNENVGLLAFEASRLPGRNNHQLFVRLRNFSPQPRQPVLSLYREDQLLRVERLTLQPQADYTATYEARLDKPGLLRAEIEVADDLAADNVAYAVPETGDMLSVLLVSPGNLFLEQGLLVMPGVSLYQAANLSATELAGAVARYDVVILDRKPPAALPDRGGLLLLGTASSAALPATTALAQPRITEWERTHPTLLHVDLGAVQIARAAAFAASATWRPIARDGEAGVLLAGDTGRRRLLACGFDLLDTDWPLRVSFPIFLGNAVQWLAEAGGHSRLRTMRTGQVLRVTAPPGVSQVTLTRPGGRRERLDATHGEVTIADTGKCGVYALQAGEKTRRWAADLRDPAESDLTPQPDLKLGETRIVSGTEAPRQERHLWPWLALLALGLLLVEWHLYHRRY